MEPEYSNRPSDTGGGGAQVKKARVNKVTPNLSRAIAQLMVCAVGDRVDCTRVFGDFYRVNWWAPMVGVGTDVVPDRAGLLSWATSTTHRVRESRLLHALRRDGRVCVSEIIGAN